MISYFPRKIESKPHAYTRYKLRWFSTLKSMRLKVEKRYLGDLNNFTIRSEDQMARLVFFSDGSHEFIAIGDR